MTSPIALPRRMRATFVAALTAAALVAPLAFAPAANASSHREAPLIAMDPAADTTDLYAFVSPDQPDSLTIIANWYPFQHADGGPNFHRFADDVRYEIHVDNNGDAAPDITYRLRFETQTMNPATFLYNTGPVTSLDDPDLNVRQTYTLSEVRSGFMPMTTVLGSDLPVAPANIGSKSTPNYVALAESAVRDIPMDGGAMRAFAGPREDPFFVDLGSIFDLLSLRNQAAPIGYGPRTPGVDSLAGYNVHGVALQIPIDHLTMGDETVLGIWATSSRQATTTLGTFATPESSGPWVQVSRLGMPLTNEVVLPRALKDAFNAIPPTTDLALFTSDEPAGKLLAQSVLTPELGTLLGALYGVPAPAGPRTDLVSIFLTGMQTAQPFEIQTPGGPVTVPAGTNVNQPANVRPAEMLRINTAPAFRPGVKDTLCGPPNYALGVLGGDVCGFPNGRRLADDVTDIALLAVAGAAYPVLTAEGFDFNAGLISVLDDGVSANDRPYLEQFPYVAPPHQGQEHGHSAIWRNFLSFATKGR